MVGEVPNLKNSKTWEPPTDIGTNVELGPNRNLQTTPAKTRVKKSALGFTKHNSVDNEVLPTFSANTLA